MTFDPQGVPGQVADARIGACACSSGCGCSGGAGGGGGAGAGGGAISR